jgi:hypothetical protein
MHVAVAGVHVQGDENAAAQHLLVDGLDAGQHRAEGIALEQGFQRRLEFGLPRHPQAVILQLAEALVEFVEQRLPAGAHAGDKFQRLLALVAQQQFRIEVGVARVQRQFALQEFRQRIGQRDLVRQRQLDVDPFDAVAVVAHARQRNDDVLVDLEGVGVLRDRGGAGAVEPELLARLGRDGDEALGAACVGHAHDFRGGGHHRRVVSADYVADQHHLGPAVALCLGRVADGAHVALVEVFQSGQLHAGRQAGAAGLEVIGDLDDRRHGVGDAAEEFEADRARHRRHLVQHPHRRGDQAVGAFLLHAGDAGEELVGDVLAQALLAEQPAGHVEDFLAQLLPAVASQRTRRKLTSSCSWILPKLWFEAFDVEPVAVGRHHAPRGQVVQRRAPQHGLLAAGVHRDVAADAGGVGRGRVAGEDQAGLFRRFHDAPCDQPAPVRTVA